MTPAEIITSIGLLFAGLAALVKSLTGLLKVLRKKDRHKRK